MQDSNKKIYVVYLFFLKILKLIFKKNDKMSKILARIFKTSVYLFALYIIGNRIYNLESIFGCCGRNNIKKLIEEKTISIYRDEASEEERILPISSFLESNSAFMSLRRIKYNVNYTCITIEPCPSTTLRMNGTKNDEVIYNITKQDKNKRKQLVKHRYQHDIESIKQFDAKFYNVYTNLKQCPNYKLYLKNKKLYPNNIFSITSKTLPIKNGKYFIYTHKRFIFPNLYYIIYEKGGVQTHRLGIDKTTTIVGYVKLNKIQLMNFDKGRLWKLIKDNKIII